jgi:uncharacterized heparinase superfamily protein
MAFPEGGYYLLGSEFDEPDEVKIVVDAGPLGYLSIAAHGHADCLSFTLSIAGHPILIDPGTYTYHEDPAWRDYFRGTPAHNTVTVDGVSQSVMGGPFMWLHKAVASNARSKQDGSMQSFIARHNGYCRLDDPVTHERRLDLSPHERSLSIVDIIKAKQDHTVDRHWHFAPECHVAPVSDTAVSVKVANIEMRCTFERGVVTEVFRGSDSPLMGWSSPRFGELVSCPSLRLRADYHGSGEFVTNFQWKFS